MLVHSREVTITVSAGAGAEVVTFKHEHVKQIVVVPPSASAEYDFALENPSGTELFDEDDIVGTFNETTDLWCKDLFTLRISNASADGAYAVTVISYEPHG